MGAAFFPRGPRDGRTDRYDEANSRFSQFCECTYYVEGPSSHVPVSVIYYVYGPHHWSLHRAFCIAAGNLAFASTLVCSKSEFTPLRSVYCS